MKKFNFKKKKITRILNDCSCLKRRKKKLGDGICIILESLQRLRSIFTSFWSLEVMWYLKKKKKVLDLISDFDVKSPANLLPNLKD